MSRPDHRWTPEEREQAQDAVMAYWLRLNPSEKNKRLERVGAMARVSQRIDQRLTVDDVTATYREWGRAHGLDAETIRMRVKRGWPLHDVLFRGEWKGELHVPFNRQAGCEPSPLIAVREQADSQSEESTSSNPKCCWASIAGKHQTA